MSETYKQRKDRFWPNWFDQCSDPDVIRQFHQEQMRRNAVLFLQTINVLENKIAHEGTIFDTPRNDYVDRRLPLNLRSHAYNRYRVSVAVSKEVYGSFTKFAILTTPIDQEFRIDTFTDFIYIAKEWNFDGGGYEYIFNRRTLIFDLEKLGNSSLIIPKSNDSSRRSWFVEIAGSTIDDVDVEDNLKEILDATRTWIPVSR